jgi:isochorismate synthase
MPVLANLALDIGAPDLPALTRTMTRAKEFLFSWEPPETRTALTGGGSAVRIRASGRARFAEAAEKIESVFRLACSGGLPSPGPFAFGGFSFFDDVDDAQWPGFGAAQLVIPEWMMLRTEAGTLGMVNALVPPDGESSLVAGVMSRTAARLRKAALAVGEGENDDLYATVPRFAPLDGEEGHQKWLRMISSALEDIRSGRLIKVVLARTADMLCRERPSPHLILRHLRRFYKDCFKFMVDPGEGQIFLGATPEQLALFKNGTVQLGALASTAPRGKNRKDDETLARLLLESGKERQEHEYVVNGILERIRELGEVAPIGEPRVVKFSNLQHLYTPITLRPRESLSAVAVVERLHPTPAVGGLPGPQALRHIRKAEGFDRGWYAGPVGWLNGHGEGEFAVALRSCILKDKRVRLFAGGGIVADSDPEMEFAETELKMKPILAALANE